MKTFRRILGMAWATPVVRTLVQAAAGAFLASLVADGSVAVALTAALAALSAKAQAKVREPGVVDEVLDLVDEII